MMRPHLLALVVVACTAASCAEAQFNLAFGARDEANSDTLPAMGVAADFGPETWPIRPEVSVSIAFELLGGDETEISGGVVHYWEPGWTRVHLGAGVSKISTGSGANTGSSTGFYVHGGLSWQFRATWMGIDARYVHAEDFESNGTTFPVGYFQIAFLLGW
jgi:hypothetical protein